MHGRPGPPRKNYLLKNFGRVKGPSARGAYKELFKSAPLPPEVKKGNRQEKPGKKNTGVDKNSITQHNN